jgi:hypothetical protein
METIYKTCPQITLKGKGDIYVDIIARRRGILGCYATKINFTVAGEFANAVQKYCRGTDIEIVTVHGRDTYAEYKPYITVKYKDFQDKIDYLKSIEITEPNKITLK